MTWRNDPVFSGLEAVTNAEAATCAVELSWSAAVAPCGGDVMYSVYRDTTSGFTPSMSLLLFRWGLLSA